MPDDYLGTKVGEAGTEPTDGLGSEGDFGD
jgi:hypothetical protein